MTGSSKKAGRPSLGITQEKQTHYYGCIQNWVHNRKLAEWLEDPEKDIEAVNALNDICLTGENDTDQLEQWRKDWLSEAGWKRLQANVRQKMYARGSADGRERKKTLQLEVSTVTDLKFYAESQGMTINQAVKHLLKLTEGTH